MTSPIIQAHDAYLSPNYPRYPIAITSGSGVTITDDTGKTYLDLFAGFGAPVLGHCHPDLVQAVADQAGKLWHVGNLFHTEPQTRAAKAIHDHGFGGLSFFSHAGADANEAAIKLARLYGGAHPGPNGQRFGVISTTRSFHGRSFATMGATGNPKVREGFGPLPKGFVNVAYNSIAAVRDAIDDDTVAVIAEPVQGEGGINVPDPDYFSQLRALCDERDLLLICDEVWTGVGRTGKWFGYQHWFEDGARGPDIITLGKGVGGGLAVGVMCATPQLAELYNAAKHGVKHATTLGGNCLSMAVTAKIFEVIQRDGLLENAATLGDHALQRLTDLADSTGSQGPIKSVRGKGLFIGIELNTQASDAWDSAADVVNLCLDRGVLFGAAQGEVIRLAPALVITQAQLDEGLDTLEAVLNL